LALSEAGFDSSTFSAVELPLRFTLPEPDDLFVLFATGTGRTRALLELQSLEAREAIRIAMATSMEEYRSASGSYEVPAIAIVFSAVRAF